ANGAISSLAACSSDINTNAQAPSFTPGAFPAVTVPSLSNAGFNFSNTSSVVPSRGASSVSTIIGSPRLCGTSTGTISEAYLSDATTSNADLSLLTSYLYCSFLLITNFLAVVLPYVPICTCANEQVNPSWIIKSTTF